MYIVSRCLIGLSILIGLYGLFVTAVLFWPWSAAIVVGLLAIAAATKKRSRLTTLGSARWADQRDFQKAGMLNASSGLILGYAEVSPDRKRALRSLFDPRKTSQDACRLFWDLYNKDRWRIVRLQQAVHTAIFAPTGTGKGVSIAVPYLLTCDESCVVVDLKGELCRLTAEHRRKQFGNQIVTIDPFHVVTNTPDSYNPLDSIDADHPFALDQCIALAKALVVRTPDEKEPHWNDNAEARIAGTTGLVVQYGSRNGLRSLQTVLDLFSSPERVVESVRAMQESDVWGGALARMGGQAAHQVDREMHSILSTVCRHLRWLNTPAVSAVTETTSFDPTLINNGKITIYLVLPVEHLRALSALMRTWLTSFLMQVVRGGIKNTRNVHFIVDEAAALGNLEILEDALDKFRGFSVRLQLYYQSLGQLKKCFPNGQDQVVLSNTTQIFFAVNEVASAEYISTRCGDHTVIVESGGTSYGTSSQDSMGVQPSQSRGYSTNSSSNWQQQARKLLKPEEVIALPPRTAITFAPGVPPICTTLIRYYEEPLPGLSDKRSTRFREDFIVLARSLWMFLVTVFYASMITLAALFIK